MTEQFISDYDTFLYKKGGPEILERMQTYLRSLDETGKKKLRNQFRLHVRSMAQIEDLELFQLMNDVFVNDYSSLIPLVTELTKTPNREKQYALLQNKMQVFFRHFDRKENGPK